MTQQPQTHDRNGKCLSVLAAHFPAAISISRIFAGALPAVGTLRVLGHVPPYPKAWRLMKPNHAELQGAKASVYPCGWVRGSSLLFRSKFPTALKLKTREINSPKEKNA